MQRKRKEATKPQKPTTKEQQATNDTDNPDDKKHTSPTHHGQGANIGESWRARDQRTAWWTSQGHKPTIYGPFGSNLVELVV